MTQLFDWLYDWFYVTFKTRFARVILAISIALYLSMLLIFGGPMALLIGTAGLFNFFIVAFLVVGFIVWVVNGSD